jgi:hypothetical protein
VSWFSRKVTSRVKKAAGKVGAVAKVAVTAPIETAKQLKPSSWSELPSKLFVAPLTMPVSVGAGIAKDFGVGGRVERAASYLQDRADATLAVADDDPKAVLKGAGAAALTVAALYTGGATLPLAAKLAKSATGDVVEHEVGAMLAQDARDAQAAAVADSLLTQPPASSSPPPLTFGAWLASLFGGAR